MNRIAFGGASVLLLVTAGFFLWQSYAEDRDPLLQPPPRAAAPARAAALPRPEPRPEEDSPARARSKEEKRFNRADRDKDGRITLAELLAPRRKAFDKLDTNHDGKLSFEEWTAKTADKFRKADADRNGWLSRAEFAATKRRTKPKTAKCACRPAEDSTEGDRQD